ncbi:MAG: TonB-dependent receptor [Prevotellaceae bacterium]|jgi:outer membrane receptor for ferrienterochelin and colicin|nr:TonB-dependent receptor [Prevotellaceae bacterium]
MNTTIRRYQALIVSLAVAASAAHAQDAPPDSDTARVNTLDEVVVRSKHQSNYISAMQPVHTEVISSAGLKKMACCSLAESFENNASISVGYSDAVSGARQIRLLGLSGGYTQMLDEARPAMRGLSAPFGLSYIPGQWLQSVQIAKGAGSVANGYESIAGQINLELRKPTAEEPLFVNVYFDHFLRTEANIVSSLQLGDKWNTAVLAHASGDLQKQDDNGDGFMDEPMKRQLNLANRWIYLGDNGTQWRFGVQGLQETREGGQINAGGYSTNIENTHFNAYSKVGMPLNDDNTYNLAVVADYTFHDLRSSFGKKAYDGRQQSGFANVLLQNFFTDRHHLTTGLTGRWDDYNEMLYGNRSNDSATHDLSRRELSGGVFGEYTLNLGNKFVAVAGLRADYHNLHQWLLTPRLNVKYDFTKDLVLRGSAGRGYRSANIVTDNIGMLATGYEIKIDNALNMEAAWTYGGSLLYYFKLFNYSKSYISIDYFRTDFSDQVLVDYERELYKVWIYNLAGKSYTNTYQFEFNTEPLERFTISATFRYNDNKTDLTTNSGQAERVETPLRDRYKGILNLQYGTRRYKWTFDATAQLNGQSRLPNFMPDDYSPVYPLFFAQITRKFKGMEIYAGVENILDYKQPNPIVHAEAPFSEKFNSSVIWGPLMGRRIYAGVRYTLY